MPQSDRLHHGQTTLQVKCEHYKDCRRFPGADIGSDHDDLQSPPPKDEKPGLHKDQVQSGETQGPQHRRHFSGNDRMKVCSSPRP